MKMSQYRRWIGAVAALVILGWFSAVSADGPPRAFAPGEKLTFALKWGFIPAGRAVLEVQSMKVVNGVPSYHFVMQAKTNAIIDSIYRYRSRVDAYADRHLTRSLHYHKKTEFGVKTKEDTVRFDWVTNEARFNRKGTYPGENPVVQTEQRRIPLMQGTFDPLSVFYYTRQLQVGPGAPIERPVSDGRKCVMATAMILRRENLRINGREYDTYLVEPDLKHVGGVFEKSKDAKIQLWVTADERRIPVKIRSKVFVGHFTGELVSVEPSNYAAYGGEQAPHARIHHNEGSDLRLRLPADRGNPTFVSPMAGAAAAPLPR